MTYWIDYVLDQEGRAWRRQQIAIAHRYVVAADSSHSALLIVHNWLANPFEGGHSQSEASCYRSLFGMIWRELKIFVQG